MIIINMANEWHTKEGTRVRRSRRPQTQLIAFREAPCAKKKRFLRITKLSTWS